MAPKFSRSPLVLVGFLLSLQIYVCRADYNCEWTNGGYVCEWEDDVDLGLILGLGIAIPLIILIACIIGCCCCCAACPMYMNRKKQGSPVVIMPQQQMYPMGPNGQPAYPQQGYGNYPGQPQGPPAYPQQGYPGTHQAPEGAQYGNNAAPHPAPAPGWVGSDRNA